MSSCETLIGVKPKSIPCALTRNQVVANLYASKEFNECINRMEPAHLRDDLRAEVTLVLLELPEERLLAIVERGHLLFFAVRVILNMIKSNGSTFARMYRQHITDRIPDVPCPEMNGRVEREQREELALSRVGDLSWYQSKMIELYIETGSYRAMEAETGIPWDSCYWAVQQAIKKLRDKI